jgi:drug/metabolite transporter (DMT)-like permease
LKHGLALIVTGCVWGYSWVQMKIALAYSTPFEFAALRSVIAAAGLFAVLAALRKSLRPPIPVYAAVVGVVQIGGFSLLTMLALEFGGVGRSSILAYTFPLWVALFAWPLLGERPHGLQIAAFPIALIGFAFMLFPFDAQRGLIGAACAVGAGIVWAIGAVLMKFAGRRRAYDALAMTAWQGLFGASILLVGAAIAPHAPIDWNESFVFALLFSALASYALGWFLWTYALSGLPAGVASFGTLLSPLVGAVSAALQLGERDPLPQVAGFAILFVALIVFALERAH